MLEPMDVCADSSGVSNSLGRASGIKVPAREAFLTSLKRINGINDRSPLLDEFLKDNSPYMSTRSKLGMPLPVDEVQCQFCFHLHVGRHGSEHVVGSSWFVR